MLRAEERQGYAATISIATQYFAANNRIVFGVH